MLASGKMDKPVCFFKSNNGESLMPSCRSVKFFILCSGWRPDPTDKCVQFVKLASAETRSSLYMGGEVQGNKTPGKCVCNRSHYTVKLRLSNHNKTFPFITHLFNIS